MWYLIPLILITSNLLGGCCCKKDNEKKYIQKIKPTNIEDSTELRQFLGGVFKKLTADQRTTVSNYLTMFSKKMIPSPFCQ